MNTTGGEGPELAMSDGLPTDDLRAEHRDALEQVIALEAAVGALQAGQSGDWAQARVELQRRIKRLREGLLLHFRREEEGLFPDVLTMVSRDAPRVDILSQFFQEEADDDLTAHTLLRARTKDLSDALDEMAQAQEIDATSAARLATLVGLTKDLLERHANKEHELVFPMIERLLDESQMAAASARMREISPKT